VITNGNKLACAQRELAFRQRVYPRWIEQGRYTEVKAALEIAMMEAVVEDYRKLADAERREGRLLWAAPGQRNWPPRLTSRETRSSAASKTAR
jgi:hypothetical protein